MKKRVNGKVVDIKNIELFKLGYEGQLLNKRGISKIEDTIENKGILVKDAVTKYREYLKKLVFPLNMIEEPIKYTMIGMLLQKELDSQIIICIGDGLLLKINEDVQLHMVAGTWSIEALTIESKKPFKLSLDVFEDTVGYKEYKWAYEQLSLGLDTSDYYKEFMPDFVAACNNKDIIIRWELSRLLDFGTIPKQQNFADCKIVDYNDNREYTVDIYCSGKREVNNNIYTLIQKQGKTLLDVSKEKKDVYNFDLYEKSLNTTNNKTKKVDGPEGLASVFDAILLNGLSDDGLKFYTYRGFMKDSYLIFEVNRNIYISDIHRYTGVKKLISNVTLYALENNRIYVTKRNRLDSGIFENTLYSYDLIDTKVRLCRISFTQ